MSSTLVPSRKPSCEAVSRLPRKVEAALADFQRRVLELFPNDIRQLILYGSYARGDWDEESDVDVMVVVNWADPRQAGASYYLPGPGDLRWVSIMDAGTDSMIEHGPLVSPFIISEKLFDTNLPVACDAREEGVVLWPQSHQPI